MFVNSPTEDANGMASYRPICTWGSKIRTILVIGEIREDKISHLDRAPLHDLQLHCLNVAWLRDSICGLSANTLDRRAVFTLFWACHAQCWWWLVPGPAALL